MRLRVTRREIRIEPESETDEAYIEEVLGLREPGDYVRLERVNHHNLPSLSCMRTARDLEGDDDE